MIKQKKGFTIVELIVVITILSILSTIGFISYSGYLIGVRDANRTSQLESIEKGFTASLTRGKLPLPENYVEIKSGSEIIGYQGTLGKNVLETIDYSGDGFDPLDKTYFTYYLTNNRKYFQIMAYLEDETNLQLTGIFNTTYADIDYTYRYPTFVGKKLGMILREDNTTINSTGSLVSFDISNVGTDNYKSYLTDQQFVYGSGTIFSGLVDVNKVAGKYYSVVANTFVYNDPN